MVERKHLLTTKQMATFCTQGFVRIDKMLSPEFCRRLIDDIDSNRLGPTIYDKVHIDSALEGTSLSDFYRLPNVRGAIESLLGPDPTFDHYAVHRVPGQKKFKQALHQDAEYDVRPLAFDIQISIFPEDTPLEKGGTIFLPGSHFRRVHESQIGRYQFVAGQIQTVCEAGTVVFWHHNIWHGASSNHTDDMRYMIKTRLNPTYQQTLTWNTDDLHDPEIHKILQERIHWHSQEHRLELMNRAKLWRHLTDDPDFDLTYYWTRTTNEPTRRVDINADQPVA